MKHKYKIGDKIYSCFYHYELKEHIVVEGKIKDPYTSNVKSDFYLGYYIDNESTKFLYEINSFFN